MQEQLSNKVIGGCRLEQLIGRGGMGSVYKARHLALQIPVVIKVLDPQLAKSQTLVERFQLEARAAARLDSPYIARVMHVGEEGGLNFIQMEYINGESLAQKLEREAPLGATLVLQLLYQIVMGLTVAHEQQIIHRDIKPENILLNEKGIIKIIDFGLAKSMQENLNLTNEGQFLGTPYYLSPEQCAGKKIDARSDIYSLGIAVYYMLTGILPFSGDSLIAIASARLHNDPVPMQAIRVDIPDDIAMLTQKMIARSPEQRWSSSNELLGEIHNLLRKYDITPNVSSSNIPAVTNSNDDHRINPEAATMPFGPESCTKKLSEPALAENTPPREPLPSSIEEYGQTQVSTDQVIKVDPIDGATAVLDEERKNALLEDTLEYLAVPDEVIPNKTVAKASFANITFQETTMTSAPKQSKSSRRWLIWVLLVCGLGLGLLGYWYTARFQLQKQQQQVEQWQVARKNIVEFLLKNDYQQAIAQLDKYAENWQQKPLKILKQDKKLLQIIEKKIVQTSIDIQALIDAEKFAQADNLLANLQHLPLPSANVAWQVLSQKQIQKQKQVRLRIAEKQREKQLRLKTRNRVMQMFYQGKYDKMATAIQQFRAEGKLTSADEYKLYQQIAKLLPKLSKQISSLIADKKFAAAQRELDKLQLINIPTIKQMHLQLRRELRQKRNESKTDQQISDEKRQQICERVLQLLRQQRYRMAFAMLQKFRDQGIPLFLHEPQLQQKVENILQRHIARIEKAISNKQYTRARNLLSKLKDVPHPAITIAYSRLKRLLERQQRLYINKITAAWPTLQQRILEALTPHPPAQRFFLANRYLSPEIVLNKQFQEKVTSIIALEIRGIADVMRQQQSQVASERLSKLRANCNEIFQKTLSTTVYQNINQKIQSLESRVANSPGQTKPTIPCSKCQGTGKIKCSRCANSPRPGYIPCQKCINAPKVLCRYCKGRGKTTREIGTTKTGEPVKKDYLCKKCNGTGYKQCIFCKGKGFVRCKNCNGGEITCPACLGSGVEEQR